MQMEISCDRLNKNTQQVAMQQQQEHKGFMNKTYTKENDILGKVSRNTEKWEDNNYVSRLGRRKNESAKNRQWCSYYPSTVDGNNHNFDTLIGVDQRIDANGPVKRVSQLDKTSYFGCREPHNCDIHMHIPKYVCFIKHDLFTNTNNPKWKNHPNFK